MTNVTKDVTGDERTRVVALRIKEETLHALRFAAAEANTTVGRLLKDEAERIAQTAEGRYIAARH